MGKVFFLGAGQACSGQIEGGGITACVIFMLTVSLMGGEAGPFVSSEFQQPKER